MNILTTKTLCRSIVDFRDRGRLAPEGLIYLSSWVDEKLQRCFQIMETENRDLLDQWMANWSDLVDFEVFPVMSSQQAAEKIAPHLEAKQDAAGQERYK